MRRLPPVGRPRRFANKAAEMTHPVELKRAERSARMRQRVRVLAGTIKVLVRDYIMGHRFGFVTRAYRHTSFTVCNNVRLHARRVRVISLGCTARYS